MSQRKQQLLKKHRKNKRFWMLGSLLAIGVVSLWLAWWLFPLGLLVMWAIHEAWLADHIFYSPAADYQYQFPQKIRPVALRIEHGCLSANGLEANQTLIVQVRLRSHFSGRFFDPKVWVGDDEQVFERGANGVRYLNVTGQVENLRNGLQIKTAHCSIDSDALLWCFEAPVLSDRSIMILAPHADDAELAAFGLYSAHSANTSIVTLTQGEIEADHYHRLGLTKEEAARLKGRLRAWDSLAIPLWGGGSTAALCAVGVLLPSVIIDARAARTRIWIAGIW